MKKRLLNFWNIIKRLLTIYFTSIGIFVTVFNFLILFLIIYLSSGDGSKETYSSAPKTIPPLALKLTLKDTLSESPQSFEDLFFHAFSGKDRPTSLANVTTSLRRAILDDGVKALVIEFRHFALSKSSTNELSRWIEKFKSTGKKVYIWSDDLGMNLFELASIADRLEIAPGGGIEIPGPILQLTYFGEALRKLGIEFQVLRAGKYKSAFESFIQNQPSKETREVFTAIEQNLKQHLLTNLSKRSGKSIDVVKTWLNQGIYTAFDAKESGLVHDFSFYNDFENRIVGQLNTSIEDESISLIRHKDYLVESKDIDENKTSETDDAIGVIYARGEILMSADRDGSNITYEGIHKEIEWMKKQEDIKGVVLRIDSPGGSASASDLIWHDLVELNKVKPIVVSMANTAASGGYYMAVAGKKIIAEPTTITGSIGVIGALPKAPNSFDKYGVSFHNFSSSERKNIYNFGEKLSPLDRSVMARSIDKVYEMFLTRVAQGRNMKVNEVHELAQGRVYTGIEALELGLVDELGGMHDAYTAVKEIAGLNPEKLYGIRVYEPELTSLRDCLKGMGKFYKCFSDFDSSLLLKDPTRQNKFLRELNNLTNYLDNGKRYNIMARLPYIISTL